MVSYTLKAIQPAADDFSTKEGLSIIESFAPPMMSLAPFKGQEDRVNQSLKRLFAMELPAAGIVALSDKLRLYSIAKDQWMIESVAEDGNLDAVKEEFSMMVAVTDQQDSWCCFTLSGPNVLHKLERLCPIDLHDSAFPVNSVARTMMEHLNVIIIRDADTAFGERSYRLMTATSYRESFIHALTL